MSLVDMKSQLREIIAENYQSEAECARKMGWTRQKLNKLTNGIKEPDVSEVQELSVALHKPILDITLIFLAYWSPNGVLSA